MVKHFFSSNPIL